MSRITGREVANLMEAYSAVYAPQELTEEQVWEEVENWVNSLVEEGYDLSEYTWEDMYEAYLSEAIGQPGSAGMVNWKDPKTGQVRSGYKSSSDGKLYANYNDALAARNSRMQGLAVQQGLDRTFRAGGGNAAVAQGRSPLAVVTQGSTNLQRQQQRTTTAAAAPPANGSSSPRPQTAAAPAGSARTAPVAATPTPAAATPTPAAATPTPAAPARPSLGQGIADLQAMRSASVMRQNNMSLPGARVPTSTDIRASQTAAAARQAPAPVAAPRPVATAPRPQPQVRRPAPTRAPILQRAHFDPFDVVMGYLLDEGYADTEESAVVIMANMSEEWKQSIVEGYGKKEEDCVDKEDKNKHNCAKKVCHEEFGEGTCIYGHHSEPDEYGFVSHYDVLFGHGVEKAVPTSEMEVLVSESHGNHMKK